MTDEKWQQLIDIAELQFQNVEVKKEDLIHTSEGGQEKRGTIDILIFENPKGRYKLARENRPKILGKVEHYSHRQGDTSRTEYQISDSEITHKLKVYEDTGFDDWEEITLDKLGLA